MNLADLLGSNPRVNRGFNQQPGCVPASTGSDTGWESHEQSGTPWRKRRRVQLSQVSSSGSGDLKGAERNQHKAHSSQYAGSWSPNWGKASSAHGAENSGSGGSAEGLAAKRRIDKATECLSALTTEQRRVLDMVVEDGMSVFFTGAAGSGKSFLLRAIVAALSASGKKDTTFVTGTTGIAACNVGGVTVHSFAGCGLGDEPLEEMMAKMERSSHAKKRWKQCQILVIDEISMLDGAFFEKLACVGARARSDPRPFGGIQLVLCGDFFQLPPVGINQKKTTIFCFEAPVWPTAVPRCVVLSSAFRQSDSDFLHVLNDIRTGSPSEQTLAALRANEERCSRNETIDVVLREDDHRQNNGSSSKGANGSSDSSSHGAECVATKLYARNVDVDRVNEKELAKLDGPALFFNALDEGDERQLSTLTRNCPAPARLELKVGAQVMLLKNTDVTRGLANGARGVVVGFEQPEEGGGFQGWGPLPKVAFKVATNSNKNASSGVGAGGRSSGGSGGGGKSSSGYRTVTAVIEPAEWSLELGRARVARRMQVPLRCAWAISIHKSQGMTISQLEVDFSGCFEVGQAYVALSRATSLQSLRLKGLSTRAVRAHPSVVAFYRQLDRDAKQAANQKEGDDEEAVAEAELLNSNKATNNIINNDNTTNSSSTNSSGSSSSSRAAGWAPSRAPLQPWVCPGFNGGANSDGWIQRPHNGKVSAPKSFEEDTWMDQGTCVTGRAHLSASARAAAVASGHHPSASPVVFLPGSRSYPASTSGSFNPTPSGNRSASSSSSSSSSSGTRPGSMPSAQPRQPSSMRSLDAHIGSTGGSSWGGVAPASHSAATPAPRSVPPPRAVAPPPPSHAKTPYRGSSAAPAPKVDRATTAASKHAPQKPAASSKSNYSSGAHGILLSSEQQARMESNRNRALALMAQKGKRRLY